MLNRWSFVYILKVHVCAHVRIMHACIYLCTYVIYIHTYIHTYMRMHWITSCEEVVTVSLLQRRRFLSASTPMGCPSPSIQLVSTQAPKHPSMLLRFPQLLTRSARVIYSSARVNNCGNLSSYVMTSKISTWLLWIYMIRMNIMDLDGKYEKHLMIVDDMMNSGPIPENTVTLQNIRNNTLFTRSPPDCTHGIILTLTHVCW